MRYGNRLNTGRSWVGLQLEFLHMPNTINSGSLTESALIFDSLKLAHDRQRVAGLLPVVRLSRLVEGLHSSRGDIDYAVIGDVDNQERPLLRIKASGVVELQCQRCLDGFVHGIDVDTALRLVAPELLDAECVDDPTEPDCVAASTELDLAALIEDEVLLSLPPYPMHESDSCAANISKVPVETQNIGVFSALKALKSR